MLFGLTNSLATFQAIMNKSLRDLINTEKVVVFIDNVIIGIEEEEGHDEIVEEVVKRLAENDLYVKPEKYKWKVREVRFLGVVIRLEGIKIKEEKVKGVLNWLTLKGVKNIQKFLELANYYCWFIKDFVAITRPLHDMVKELVLVAPDLDKKMRMEVDALNYTIEGVLSMECKDGK